MKKSYFDYTRVLYWASLFFCLQVNAQEHLSLNWGLENTTYFNEVPLVQEERHANDTLITKVTYRYIKQNKQHADSAQGFAKRLDRLWQTFKQTTTEKAVVTERAFTAFIARNDSGLLSLAKRMSPALYFHFSGNQEDYTLESITVTTLAYEEHKDVNFSVNEAWYDIELKHSIGTHTFLVGTKPSFKGNVRAVFNFQSDNYAINSGMTPTGQFTLNITFTFLHKGKRVSVSTGVFKMDI